MFCSIHWSDSHLNIWKETFQKVNNTNILQTPAYGAAMQAYKGLTPRYGVIEIDGQTAGCVQMLEKRALGGLLGAYICDRGPLWLTGYGDFEHFKAFAAALRDHYPKRLGRSMRFIPEIAPSEEVDALLKTHGFRKKTKEYQSLTVDLTQTEENLRANLRKNWHSTLKKAEKSGLSVEWDEDGLHLPWLLKFYSFDKKTKGYDGPSVELLEALSKTFTPEKGMVIARAMLNKRAVGAILIFCHGRASTYQIGWNAQEGRKHGAHNLLLWNALLYLKARGATEFDLGGVNDEDARSIKTFKEGLGANLVSLAGLYTS